MTFYDNGSLVEHLANGKLNSQGTWKAGAAPNKFTFELRTGFSGTITLLAARDRMQVEVVDPSGKKTKVDGIRQGD